MLRKVINQVQGYRTQDGAGVSLVRVLGNQTDDIHDPFLMLDSFDSIDPKDYIKGFPMHPHRGIETVTLDVKGENKSVMVFTLLGDAKVSGTEVKEKTAVKLSDGDTVEIEAVDTPIEILYMCSEELKEPIAWYGPIVMNTREELIKAYEEMDTGEFIKKAAKYENN